MLFQSLPIELPSATLGTDDEVVFTLDRFLRVLDFFFLNYRLFVVRVYRNLLLLGLFLFFHIYFGRLLLLRGNRKALLLGGLFGD